MKTKVVYLLGAGFSAGLGLPVTANFLSRARDLRDQSKDNILSDVLDRIDELSGVKNFFHSNLFNIEEALSILEIDEVAAERLPAKSLRAFIEHVIRSYTPRIDRAPSDWRGGKLKDIMPDDTWRRYAAFTIGLFGRRVTTVPGTSYLQCEADPAAIAEYSVITLNYDRILEIVCDRTTTHPFQKENAIGFDTIMLPRAGAPSLVKLHGSVDEKILIPPTWQKGLNPDIKPLLQRGHSLLREANHIRILGYSLPVTDAYVPYLLKAGLRAARNLKSIDVLCLDNAEHDVEKRYAALIDFQEYKFKNESVVNYMSAVEDRIEAGAGFEAGHNIFFFRPVAQGVTPR